MRLTEVRIQGFQSFKSEQVIALSPTITLLTGRNNVGKSATLRALRAPVERQEGARSDFALTLTWEIPADELHRRLIPAGTSSLDWEQRISTISQGSISARLESTRIQDGVLEPSSLMCTWLHLASLGWTATGERGTKIGWIDGDFAGSASGTDLFRGLVESLSRQVTFIAPRRVGQGVQMIRPQVHLHPDASNLTDVVAYIVNNKGTSLFPALKEFLTAAFPEIRGFSSRMVTDDSSGNAQAEIVLYTDDSPDGIPLRLCGSGVEQLLALAVAVATAGEDQVFLVDEPQAYLHPHAERSLLSLMQGAARHQFIVATHSHYLLSAVPISAVRLLVLGAPGTQAVDETSHAAILAELGVKASDLWLADAILWVEGPSDAAIIEWLLSTSRADQAHGLTVRPMPDASGFSSGNRRSETKYRFCETVINAVTSLPVSMHFLFDLDDKDKAARARIIRASGGTARFLPVREIENFLLSAPAIHETLAARCAALGLPVPELEKVDAALTEAMQAYDPDSIPGAKVLGRIYQELLNSDYDKPRDGLALAKAVLELEPDRLEPLLGLVREFIPRAAGSAQLDSSAERQG